jgi:AraC-like DNA-binding protein
MAFGSHQLVFENFILKPYLKYYKEVNPLFAHTSHQQLVEEMRKGLATHYLENSHLGISEIAYLLGYSEPSAFQCQVLCLYVSYH